MNDWDIDRFRQFKAAVLKERDEVEQILGKALHYPWYKDDQEVFPGATEANGVFIGEHVLSTLAMAAARRIAELEEQEKTR